MNYPFPNRKKLVGVRLCRDEEPVEIQIENDDGEDATNIVISHNQVVLVEFDIIEPYLIERNDFELSYSVCSIHPVT